MIVPALLIVPPPLAITPDACRLVIQPVAVFVKGRGSADEDAESARTGGGNGPGIGDRAERSAERSDPTRVETRDVDRALVDQAVVRAMAKKPVRSLSARGDRPRIGQTFVPP